MSDEVASLIALARTAGISMSASVIADLIAADDLKNARATVFDLAAKADEDLPIAAFHGAGAGGAQPATAKSKKGRAI